MAEYSSIVKARATVQHAEPIARNTSGFKLEDNRPVQKKTNRTGLPDQLKSGIENLSGHSMDDVKVHYNSAQPAQLNAHAYAQGSNIHLAPGQEKHLPHEAWHVVQQKQGRVKPTKQLKSKININDDEGLEQEADRMGAKALGANSVAKTLVQKKASVQTSQLMYGAIPDQELQEDAPEPGLTTRWYQMDAKGKITARWFSIPYGWIEVGVKHKLKVFQTIQDNLLYRANKASARIDDFKSDLESAKDLVLEKIKSLHTVNEELQKFIDEWVAEHLNIKKVLISVGVTMALGIGVIYGLSLVHLTKWVYLGITGASELLAIYYAVRWIRNELLPSMAKLSLVGLNSMAMISAAYKIAYDIFNDMPLNNFVWAALPFGLIISELVAHLASLKKAKEKALRKEHKLD